MIRVALVTEHLRRATPGGIGRYASSLLRALETRPDIKVVPIQGRLPIEITSRLWACGVPRSIRADVLHATSFAFPRTVPGVPTTVFVHDVLWRGPGAESLNARGIRFHERGLSLAMRQSRRLLVPSRAVLRALVESGASRDRIVVTGEGADHLSVRPRQPDELTVLAVGTLEPRKNLARLLSAFEQVRSASAKPIRLQLVGSGAWRGQAGLPTELPPGVEVLGPVDDERLAELLAAATVFVYPSLGEGFGLPPMEAMRAGVPVVCSAVPSVAESTGDDSNEEGSKARAGNAGRPYEAVDPIDVSSIATAISRVLDSVDRRVELASLGAAWVANRTWENVAQRHVDAWADLR